MSKFVINDGNKSNLGRAVEADTYRADEFFVHFVTSSGRRLFSIRRDTVLTIERQD